MEGLNARDTPMRYLAAIESAFTATLEADPGFGGLLTKNPAYPLWHVLRGPRIGYELNELAEWVDLERFKPKRGWKVDEVGVGRNVTLFDRLRYWAYRNVLEYKKEGGLDGWNAWLSACNTRALTFNGDFAAPLDGREVWWVAKSVAKWVWQRFSLEKRQELIQRTHTPEQQARRGRKGGKKSGEVRRAMSEEKRASARLMRAQGMSYRAIAKELEVSLGIVHKWCRE
ncbi:plasmid replicase (plasmid) [Methylomarinovum tepidoasis]|uniref:Plasmid replicase n=2 Tax=Methylomarinovum tepidoasis TaxID=2840183 RepID=A0AAU9C9I5_9GAMM|nr:plasmid replicase [Methylomarinovum sp. IN45]